MRLAVKLACIVIGYAAFYVTGECRTLRVPADHATLSRAISSARDGDTVLVAAGTYSGANNRNIRIGARITLLSESGPDSTIVDCEGENGAFGFELGVSGILIDGFTITHSTDHAIKVLNQQDFIIRRCVISDGRNQEQVGVGIRVQGGAGRIEKTVFRGNLTGSSGGGLVLNSARTTVWSCVFIENRSDRFGAGILVTTNSDVTIANCLFIENQAIADGGGIQCSQGVTARVFNCTFLDNHANGLGGGINKGSNSNITIRDCIFWGNTAGVRGQQVNREDNGGDITISYCSVEGGVEQDAGWDGENIIEVQPRYERAARDPDWGLNGYFLRGDNENINAGSAAAEEVGMDTLTVLNTLEPDADEVDLGYHYDPDDWIPVGFISGTVRDAETNRAIVGAWVRTSFGQEAFTTRIGFWSIPDAVAGTFSITCSAQGYNDSTLNDIELEADQEIEIDFNLLHPEFIISQREVRAEVYRFDSTAIDFNVENTGNGPLNWSIEKRLVGEADVPPWELRRSFYIGLPLGEDRMNGVVLADSLFYIAGGSRDPNMVWVVNLQGAVVDSFPQFNPESSIGMRDLAWDGEKIWGCDERIFYGFTPDGALTDSVPAPYMIINALTYDPDREILWAAGTTTNITGVHRDGQLADLEIQRHGLRFYGLAYFAEDPDGYTIYAIVKRPEQSFTTIIKFNPDTGDTLFVTDLIHENGGEEVGGQVVYTLDPFSINLITIGNAGRNEGGDRLDIWQLTSNTSWMAVEPMEGVLNPEMRQDFTLTLYSGDFPLGDYQGRLLFNHNADQGQTIMPITMMVRQRVGVDGWDYNSLPEDFAVEAAYPNPFNGEVSLRIALPLTGRLTIDIYDMQGRWVARPVNGEFVPGRHQIVWNASRLPSGLYWCRAATSSASQVVKLALVK